MTATEGLAQGWAARRPRDWRVLARTTLSNELAAYEDARASGVYRRDLAATMMVRAMAAVFGEEETR